MNLKPAFVLICSLAISVPAWAIERGYVFIGGGVNDASEEVVSFGPAGNMQTDSGSGTYLHGGIGFSPRQNLRLEAELGYRTNPIDGVSLLPTVPPIPGIGIAGASGDIESLSVLVNAWYDLSVGERWGLVLGGGVGAAQLSVDAYTLSTFPIVFNPPITTALYADDNEWVFAYQLGAGISFALSRRLDIDLSYRYFASSEAAFRDVTGRVFKADLIDNRVLFTLRYEME